MTDATALSVLGKFGESMRLSVAEKCHQPSCDPEFYVHQFWIVGPVSDSKNRIKTLPDSSNGAASPPRATAALQRGSGKEMSSGPNRNIARSTNSDLDDRGRGSLLEEATVDDPRGAVFQPEIIALMKAVLDDAIAMLPEAKRTSTAKAEIASGILACAANGERDPTALKTAALLSVVECSHYSHDISPERRAV